MLLKSIIIGWCAYTNITDTVQLHFVSLIWLSSLFLPLDTITSPFLSTQKLTLYTLEPLKDRGPIFLGGSFYKASERQAVHQTRASTNFCFSLHYKLDYCVRGRRRKEKAHIAHVCAHSAQWHKIYLYSLACALMCVLYIIHLLQRTCGDSTHKLHLHTYNESWKLQQLRCQSEKLNRKTQEQLTHEFVRQKQTLKSWHCRIHNGILVFLMLLCLVCFLCSMYVLTFKWIRLFY